MNPEGNRQLDPFTGRTRIIDDRYISNYRSMPQTSIPGMNEYMMQFSQMMFSPYSYYGYPCPTNSFMGSIGPYRDPTLFGMNIPPEMNYSRSYYNPQTMRVISRETKEKY